MRTCRLAVCAALLAGGSSSAAEPAGVASPPAATVPDASTSAPVAPPDITQAIYRLLRLPMHIGDSWPDNLSRLWGMHCLPEDSALFSAMDCRSDLTLGSFSAEGPEGDGLSLISDDGAAVTRIKSTRLTPWSHQDCERFQVGVTQALSQAGIPALVEKVHGATRVRAGAVGDVQLTVDCRPNVQALELAEPWVYMVPGGNCPQLERAPSDLRALADSAMTGTVHDNFEELGTACNHPGYHVVEYTGQLMNGLMAAYTVLGRGIPASAPEWLLNQIRIGLSNVRHDAGFLHADSRRRLEAFLEREESPERLGSLWSAVRKNRGTVRDDQPADGAKGAKPRK